MRLLFFVLLALPAFSQSDSLEIQSGADSQRAKIELVDKGEELRKMSSVVNDQEKQERRKWYVRIAFIAFLIIIVVVAVYRRRKIS